jgi:uronate dehydrogenase
MERILITGAAGQIGKALRQGLCGSYPLVRLLDFAPLG